ncbi:hypothetical protein D3C72_1252590 [compost metagenome]
MSSTVRTLLARANVSACVLTACMAAVEKCVPVINSALLDAMKAASTDAASMAMSAQFSR